MGKISASIDMTEGKSASAVATNYVTEVSNSGITVHPSSTTANRVLINADGMEVFKSNDSVAFYGDTVRIGRDEESHIEMDYHSLQLKNKEGLPYFYVSDLRDKDDNYQATIVQTFLGNGVKKAFYVSLPVSAEISAVDSSDASNTATRTNNAYTFATAPASGATVTITYKTLSNSATAYTLGIRPTSSSVGASSVAEGDGITASGYASHAEGINTTASGSSSHAEGENNTASGLSSHSEGFDTVAEGWFSHAEGSGTRATFDGAHAEGIDTLADHRASHAEGSDTIASGEESHAEGLETTASGEVSHAEGRGTVASGRFSHASGYYTIASGFAQTVIGEYNVADADAHFIVGNGVEDERSNAFTIGLGGEITSSRSGNLLWEGGYYMTASHTARFTNNQKISDQLSGVVLVWSAYANGAPQDYDWTYYFVPKWHVAFHEGQSVDILMMNNTIASNVMCRKLVYVYDDRITGNDNNTATGTGYANNAKVLRAVIGV